MCIELVNNTRLE